MILDFTLWFHYKRVCAHQTQTIFLNLKIHLEIHFWVLAFFLKKKQTFKCIKC